MGNQVFQRLLNLAFCIAAFDFNVFSVHIELCRFNGFYQILHCRLFILGRFFLLVTDNVLNRLRKLIDISLLDVLTNLHSTFQRFIVWRFSKHNNRFFAFGFRHQAQLRFFRSICGNCQETQTHSACNISNGNTVHHLIKGKIVFSIAVFLCSKNICENHLPDTVYNRGGIHRSAFDFSLNILFFVGQEIIHFACSANVVLAHQTVQAVTDGFTHGDFVHANIVRHQNHDVIQVGRNVINIPDQVQKFQYIHIQCFNAIPIVRSSLAAFNDTADRTIQESMYGIVKTEERYKGILILLLYFLCCFLETGKHGTFTARKMLAGISVLPYFSKHFLHDDKLVRYKREVCRKFSGTGVALNIQDRISKAEQIAEDRVVLIINSFQFCFCVFILFQNTLLDDFIHRGRRKAQTGFETSLNTGKLICTNFDDLINRFLSSAGNPHFAATFASDFLNQ